MRKLDYTHSYNKKCVQEIVFNHLKKRGITKIVGLAGPNIADYLSFVKSKGFKQAEIYENDAVNLMQQINKFQPVIQTRLLYQDIYTAPVYQNVIYDLDFTCSINTVRSHVKKFNKNALVTVAIRPISLVNTIKIFAKSITSLKCNIQMNVLKTKNYIMHKISWENGNSYDVYQYKDTTQMLTFKPNF